jgi:YbgC/YbaW family acyl-CoA thioester hydrolase
MDRFERNDLLSAARVAFTAPVEVRFQDVDAAGLVFFARFFEYVHGAYEQFLASVGQALPDVLREGRWAAPLRHVEADYRAPVRYGEEIEVQLVRAAVQPSEIALGWRVCRRDGKVCVLLQTVHTFLNPRDFQRRAVPAEIREALAGVTRAENPLTL